jgi:EAL and modified HD-GYP domain-containing signal transduction protein
MRRSVDIHLKKVRMSTETAPVKATLPVSPKWAGEMRYVARQPIMNLRGHVHGYELLFRNAPDAVAGQGLDSAARTMLDNAVIFGLEWMTNGLPAFVNCTAEVLTEDLVLVLAPRMSVLTIPASLELSPPLLDCCRKLKSRGFRLALDDFTWKANLRSLAAIADYIRVDFDRFGVAERQYLRSLDGALPAMVAKRVETQEDYQHASTEGFTLFQGSYFCHPVLLKKRKVPANRMLHFEIVRMLHHDPIDIHRVSQLVLRDASLTYRLLRLINSPVYAIYQEVRSIEAAILAMGENAFRRIVTLAILSELNGEESPQILHMALLRARFCEMAAATCALDSSEQYLLGMLSLLPAMLRLPMEELTPSLPLRAEICEALQGTLNPERSLLAWLECHEQGDWETCDLIAKANGLSRVQLMQAYAESVVWSEAALRASV